MAEPHRQAADKAQGHLAGVAVVTGAGGGGNVESHSATGSGDTHFLAFPATLHCLSHAHPCTDSTHHARAHTRMLTQAG